MTPQEALKLLDSLVATIKLSRKDHQKVAQASRIISEALAPRPEPPKKKK